MGGWGDMTTQNIVLKPLFQLPGKRMTLKSRWFLNLIVILKACGRVGFYTFPI